MSPAQKSGPAGRAPLSARLLTLARDTVSASLAIVLLIIVAAVAPALAQDAQRPGMLDGNIRNLSPAEAGELGWATPRFVRSSY